MLCQNCGKNQVTTHIRKNIGGKTETWALCSECAKLLGVDAFGVGDLFSSLFSDSFAPKAAEERCKSCGASFRDISATGKVGCPDCYTQFYSRLLPSLQRIHGKSRHVGKVPSTASADAKLEHKLESLKKQLSDAVGAEEYEKAAQLRDRIKELETGEQGKG